ncbi:hypothetical protein EGW08_015175 [Elysia chlorotica]|uniref:RRM domain-containing protein n=1 Tax=Elysia chlorotica TaxID=188477 RepID=A0A3S1BWZ0_ELYCH|nr:hypothetical protein EGW08_015175 [Elysia chlorotica]
MRRPPRPHRPPGPGLGPPSIGPRGPRGPPPIMPRVPPPGLGLPHLPGMRPLPPATGPVSSCTNSNDPASMDSRLFVGNLNTLALSKEAIEAIFSPYGFIMGISMHKGYAFVQFSHPDEARRAGASEDGKNYAGQAIDINIVSQPKNRNALKRASGGRALNDETSFLDSPMKKLRPENPGTNIMKAHVVGFVFQPLFAKLARLFNVNGEQFSFFRTSFLDSPMKKLRPENPGTNQSLQRTLVTLSGTGETTKRVGATSAVKRAQATLAKKASSSATSTVVKPVKATVQKESVPAKATVQKEPVPAKAPISDILICGNCKLQFSNLKSLTDHKKVACILRVSSVAKENDAAGDNAGEPSLLVCATCETKFYSAWSLCQHCVQEHQLNIYKIFKTEAGHQMPSPVDNGGQS